jgi:hypothetical protein
MADRQTHRFQFVRCYMPDGSPFVVLTEVYLNAAGEVWSVLPVPATFIGADECELRQQLEAALADCAAHPAIDLDTFVAAAPPPDLEDEIEQNVWLESFDTTNLRKN